MISLIDGSRLADLIEAKNRTVVCRGQGGGQEKWSVGIVIVRWEKYDPLFHCMLSLHGSMTVDSSNVLHIPQKLEERFECLHHQKMINF